MATGKKSITFSDISKYTGLSKATISRYFNNPSYLTPENVKTISDALQALNYQENKLAKILAKGNTEIIGIIVPNFFYQFYSSFLNHVLNTYDQYGYKFITFLGNNDCESEKKYLNELLSYQIIGLIELSHSLSSDFLSQLGVPVVSVEREDKYISSVNTNNLLGAKMAVDLLSKNDCDIYIHINNDISPLIPAYGRIQGFIDSCQQKNLPHNLILETFSDDYAEAYQKLDELYHRIKLQYPQKKKGIFFCNDTYANIFVNILVKNGEKIPEEYQIIGFDNSPDSTSAIIPITTISQDIHSIAQNAIDLLTKQIHFNKYSKNDCSEPLSHIIVQPSLIERDTTS